MAEPTPANTKSKVEMNSATYAFKVARLNESSNLPNAIPGIFLFLKFNLKLQKYRVRVREIRVSEFTESLSVSSHIY